MPFTAAQLTAYYTALTGTAPDAQTSANFNSFATQNSAGSLSDQQTLAFVFNATQVQATFEVIESTYQFFTGASTSAAGLAFLRGDTGAGNANGLNSAFYSNFNLENRYYNFSINLAAAGGAGNAAFLATYGGLTFAQTVSTAYEAIVGTSNVGTANAAAAIADISSRQAFFTQIAQQRAGGVDAGGAAGQNVALKAIVVGYILQEANKADIGTYAKAIDQFEAAVAGGNAIYNTNTLNTYGPGGAGFGTGIGGSGNVGGTQTNVALTVNTDAPNLAQGNVQYIGTIDYNNAANTTLNPEDQIRATGANNTLTVTTVGAPAAGTVDATGGALINGVQTVNVRNVTAGTTVNVNAANLPAVSAINSFLGLGAVNATNVAGSTTLGIVGNGTATGGSLTANVVSGTSVGVLLQNGVQAGTALTLTSANGGAATVNLTSAGALNTLDNLTLAANTTTLNVTANSAFTVGTATTAAALATLNVTGTGLVNMGGTALANTVRTVTAGNGGLTATFTSPAAAALSVTTGTSVDTLTFDTLNAAANISTGGGGDVITVNGAITAGATINGGGNATLATTGASFSTVSTGFTAAQRGLVTGISTVSITDPLANGVVYDINTIGATNFRTVGAAAGTAILNAASGATVTFTNGINANTGTLNVNLAGATAATQTADVLNLVATAQAANSNLNVTTAGVETVNITANRSAATALAGATLTVNLADAAAKAITFAGNESFVFTPANTFTALTSVISTSTGNASINVGAITNSGAGFVSNGSATAPFVVTTGTGADTVTVQDFSRVTLGAGADQLNVTTTSNVGARSVFVDAAANDRVLLNGANQTVAAANVAAKIVLVAGSTLSDYLDASTALDKAIGQVSSFDFGGDTFLVSNNNASQTFQNGSDGVIQLVGIHTVGSVTAGVVTLGS